VCWVRKIFPLKKIHGKGGPPLRWAILEPPTLSQQEEFYIDFQISVQAEVLSLSAMKQSPTQVSWWWECLSWVSWSFVIYWCGGKSNYEDTNSFVVVVQFFGTILLYGRRSWNGAAIYGPYKWLWNGQEVVLKLISRVIEWIKEKNINNCKSQSLSLLFRLSLEVVSEQFMEDLGT